MSAIGSGIELGESIPPLTPHAVSVSLPTWKANVGYEEGEDWVVSKMKTGYPRFFVHKSIQNLAEAIVAKHGTTGDDAMLFPSRGTAARLSEFLLAQVKDLDSSNVRILDLKPPYKNGNEQTSLPVPAGLSAVLYPRACASIAKSFWQHSGEGISSRRAEYCHRAFEAGQLIVQGTTVDVAPMQKGPRRYRSSTLGDKDASRDHPNGAISQTNGTNSHSEHHDHNRFVEERFGRNLGATFADDAKLAIRRRIAGSLTANVELDDALATAKDAERMRDVPGFSEDDIYLYPCGMNAIFNTHRMLKLVRGFQQGICYGFPYIDTLKILEKFGPGVLFYGFGSAEELDDLEQRLARGERYLALFCEFPGNPLLRSPDLVRIRELADRYDFFVVVDETIGTLLNVNVLPYADVVVSSLTKIFSGDCNVMGGSAVLNPSGRHYARLKSAWDADFEDNYWFEDAVFLERNSRDFVSRVDRINYNAEAICDLLRQHPRVKGVMYPKHSSTKPMYDRCRTKRGGYGGLLSATFYSTSDAIAFYDALDTAKGPSLGTNFTLSSPYVILAHYNELDWAKSYGVESDLIRFSVGLEHPDDLISTFQHALAALLPS